MATTTALSLFKADAHGEIQEVSRQEYENSGVRKPGQLSPGTGSTPVFFGPATGYEYLVITDNATAAGTHNETPAQHVNIYRVADGTLVAQTDFLTASNSGTENAPIAVGDRIFVPSTFLAIGIRLHRKRRAPRCRRSKTHLSLPVFRA